MALVVGENTWATIDEVATYFNTRLGSSGWFDLEDEPVSPGDASKETYLSMAYMLLLNKPSYSLSSTLTDSNVKYAQAEMALNLLNNFDSYLSTSDSMLKGLSSFDLSEWSESYFKDWEGDSPLPTFVTFYLTAYRIDNCMVELGEA